MQAEKCGDFVRQLLKSDVITAQSVVQGDMNCVAHVSVERERKRKGLGDVCRDGSIAESRGSLKKPDHNIGTAYKPRCMPIGPWHRGVDAS